MKHYYLLCLLMAMTGLSSCAGFETIPADEFASRIADGSVQLVDVRTKEEYVRGYLPGAININFNIAGSVEEIDATLDPSKPVALYCRGGKRSAAAAKYLVKHGYEQVYDLKGGILAWAEEGRPIIDLQDYEVDIFKTDSGKEVYMYALTHASIRIEYDSLTFFVDPVSRLGGKNINYLLMPRADYVLVTHEHGDHFDKSALELMTRGQLVTNARCAEMIGYGSVMANGDNLVLRDDIKIEAVPAYNKTEGRTQLHPKGRDNGFILTLDGLRIYIAGDTEDVDEMASIKDIDVAFLPCNQPFTMTTDQLVNAVKMIGPKVVFPYHYSSTDVSVIPAQLPDTDVRIRQYQ